MNLLSFMLGPALSLTQSPPAVVHDCWPDIFVRGVGCRVLGRLQIAEGSTCWRNSNSEAPNLAGQVVWWCRNISRTYQTKSVDKLQGEVKTFLVLLSPRVRVFVKTAAMTYHSEEELKQLDKELEGADLVRFVACDLNGVARSKLIPGHAVRSAVRQGSTAPDCILAFGPRSEVPGVEEFIREGFGNGVMVPVAGTSSRVTWSKASKENSVKQVLCEFYWQGRRQGVQEPAPRTLLRRQVDALHREFGWRIKTGFESEFTVFHADTLQPVFDGEEFYMHLVNAKFEDFFLAVTQHLSGAGVQTESFLPEYGSGQFEIPLVPGMGVRAADDAFLLRQTIKEYCQAHGMLATFMTKPSEKLGAVGCHLNHSLWDDSGNNVFYDGGGKFKVSKVLWHWLGGLMAHLQALTALSNPTPNCYSRIGLAFFNPKRENWGVENRKTSLRVKNASPRLTYIENRLPSGSSNPYVTLAATIAAGMDGLRRKLEPPEKQEDTEAPLLPTKLSDALVALENDKVLVEALGAEFVDWFVRNKREIEIKKFEKEGVTCDMMRDEYMTVL